MWRSNFLWTAPSYYVGAWAAVAGSILWQTHQWWLLPLAAAPVYLTFSAYRMYVERIESEQRHKDEVLRLHGETLAALEAARQSEQRYALAAAGSNDGLWDWDVLTGALYCSERWKQMIGLSTTDSVSTLDEWLKLVDEEDRPGLRAGDSGPFERRSLSLRDRISTASCRRRHPVGPLPRHCGADESGRAGASGRLTDGHKRTAPYPRLSGPGRAE